MHTALFFLLLLLGQIGGPPQAAVATVSGLVVRQGTGEVLSKATVTLSRLDGAGRGYSTTTGADGKFIVPDVAPGQYRISATRVGYVGAEFGDRASNGCGTPVNIIAGQSMADARIAMLPAGVISGRAYDSDREGMPNVPVHAMRYEYQNGKRVLNIVQTVQTNDLGEYRLFGLSPGRYYVGAALEPSRGQAPVRLMLPSAPPGQGTLPDVSIPDFVPFFSAGPTSPNSEERYLPVYYPDAHDPASARAIELKPGDNSPGVNIPVTSVRPVSVTGRIVNSVSREAPRSLSLGIVPRIARPNAGVPLAIANPDADGTFALNGVIPGPYYVFLSGSDSVGRLFGRVSIDVTDRPLNSIVVEVLRGFELNGKVTADDSKVMERVMEVALRSNDPSPVLSASSDRIATIKDGAFAVTGLAPGEYLPFLTFRANNGVPDIYVKAMRLGSVDVRDGIRLDSPQGAQLEIVLGNNGAVVTGTVLNDKQAPAAGVTVVLVPDVFLRKRSTLYKTRKTDASGNFRFDAIGPGEYKLLAWEDVEKGAWEDPDFLRVYESRGKAVTLREGTTDVVQLAVIPSAGVIYGQCTDGSQGFR